MLTQNDLFRWAADPMAFFAETIIPTSSGDVRLDSVWAPFQREGFQVMAECLAAVAVGKKPPRRGLWSERTKGASKDSDVGLGLLWLLMFAKRPQVVELAADDFDQICETLKAMQEVIRANPWMGERVKVLSDRILCEATASACRFLCRDALGSHGSRPTVTVCNELSHCTSEEFISTVMDNADKMPNNLAILATNAGELGSWQYRWRENYRTDPDWWFQKVSTVAPWIDEKKVADAKRRNSPTRFARLWGGEWVTADGDALDAGDLEAACTLDGPIERRGAFEGAILGLDLGIKRDHSALVVLLTDHHLHRIKLAWCESWAPGPDGQVNLEEVWQGICWAANKYRIHMMSYDPWQAEFMAQKCRQAGMTAESISFQGKGATLMASTMLEVFRSRVIDLYACEPLLQDLRHLCIKEKSNGGYQLTAKRDETGHADRAMALATCLPFAWECIGTYTHNPDEHN